MSDPATPTSQHIDPLALARLPVRTWLIAFGFCSTLFIMIGATIVAFVENPTYPTLVLIAFLASAALAAIMTLASVIALAPGDFSFRWFLVFALAFWFALLTGITTLAVDAFSDSRDPWSVTWIYALLNAATVFMVPLPAAMLAFLIRRFRRWRCVGKADYWRNPPLSIAGLLGTMVLLAAGLAIANRLDLKGIPLDPILLLLACGIGVATVLSISVVCCLGCSLAGRRGFGWVLLAVQITSILIAIFPLQRLIEADDWGWAVLTIVTMNLGAAAGSLGTGMPLRRGGWRLVRARPLSEPEQARTGLARVWETVADWTTRPLKP